MTWPIEIFRQYVDGIRRDSRRGQESNKQESSDWVKGYYDGRVSVLDNMIHVIDNYLTEAKDGDSGPDTRREADSSVSGSPESGKDAPSGVVSGAVFPVDGREVDAASDVQTLGGQEDNL